MTTSGNDVTISSGPLISLQYDICEMFQRFRSKRFESLPGLVDSPFETQTKL